METIKKIYKTNRKVFSIIKESLKFFCFSIKYSFKKSNKARILIIAHDFAKAGAQVLLKNIVIELKKKNYEITVIAKEQGPLLREYKNYANIFISYDNKILKKYIISLKNKKYSVALTNTVVVGDVIATLKENGYYVVSMIHELPLLIKENKFESRAECIGKYSDVVIFPSNYVREKFETVAKIYNKVVVKPQGLYLNRGHIVDKENAKKEICERYNIDINKKIVINVATGIKRKGFDWFIQIASMLKYRNDIVFIWVGDYDKVLLDEVLENINFNRLENLYFTGYIDNPKKLSVYYDSAEILMLTSREEPFGSIVLEAFNSKTPVLGFKDGGGYVDVVKDNLTGFLVEYGQVKKMAEKLENLFDNTEQLKVVGEKCKRVVENYSFEEYIKLIENLLRNEEDKNDI